MKSFADFLSLSDFIRIGSWRSFNPPPQSAYGSPVTQDWYDRWGKFVTKTFEPIVRLYINERASCNQWYLIANDCDRNPSISRQFAALGSDDMNMGAILLRRIRSYFENELNTWLFSDRDISESYREYIRIIDDGNFAWFHLNLGTKCCRTGDYVYIQYDGWVPNWVTHGSIDHQPVILPMLPPDTYHSSIEIDIPSGELLCADWFRIDGFDELIEDDGHDISIPYGQKLRTEYYARKNLAVVQTGNCSMHVYSESEDSTDTLIFNMGNGSTWNQETDEEENSLAAFNHGSICCDLWAVSIIDRQVLHAVLEPCHGEKTDEMIDEYMDEWGTFSLDIRPGRYRITYNHHNDNILGSIDELGLDVLGCPDPYLHMTWIGPCSGGQDVNA